MEAHRSAIAQELRAALGMFACFCPGFVLTYPNPVLVLPPRLTSGVVVVS